MTQHEIPTGQDHSNSGVGHTNTPTYMIQVFDDALSPRHLELTDPVPLGRQILEAVGARPVDDFSLYAFMPNGDFEEIRPDEPFDLRGKGVEKFIAFKTDRTFKFKLDERHLAWGKAEITGAALRQLADLQPGYALYLEVRGGHDLEIGIGDVVDLSKPGVERFITVVKETTEGRGAALPSRDRDYLNTHGIAYEVMTEDGQIAVVLKDFQLLPTNKFDHEQVDLLVLLPMGYPDAPPDMFYTLPWVRLVSVGRHPTRADVSHTFGGKVWQRWSRHSNEWRPGIDGIHTMIARARHAFEAAQ
jgi:hypothetical protein